MYLQHMDTVDYDILLLVYEHCFFHFVQHSLVSTVQKFHSMPCVYYNFKLSVFKWRERSQ